jgi:hypothetical protein
MSEIIQQLKYIPYLIISRMQLALFLFCKFKSRGQANKPGTIGFGEIRITTELGFLFV